MSFWTSGTGSNSWLISNTFAFNISQQRCNEWMPKYITKFKFMPLQAKLPPFCLCLYTSSAVHPQTLTSWIPHASWPQPSTTWISSLCKWYLGSLTLMAMAWSVVQEEHQSLWRTQEAMQMFLPCSPTPLPAPSPIGSSWQVFLAWPSTWDPSAVFTASCSMSWGESTCHQCRVCYSPQRVRWMEWKSPVWFLCASSGWVGHIAPFSVLAHCEFLFHRFSHLLAKWSGHKMLNTGESKEIKSSVNISNMFNFTIQNLNHDKMFFIPPGWQKFKCWAIPSVWWQLEVKRSLIKCWGHCRWVLWKTTWQYLVKFKIFQELWTNNLTPEILP